MQDGHEDMLLLKRSSRSLCNLCAILLPRNPVRKLESSTVGLAHRAPDWGGSEARAGRTSKGLSRAVGQGEHCMKWALLKFMKVISIRAKNTSVKVIFSLFVLFQSCSAVEYKPGTSESSKGDLKISLVKKKWEHFLWSFELFTSSCFGLFGFGVFFYSVFYGVLI